MERIRVQVEVRHQLLDVRCLCRRELRPGRIGWSLLRGPNGSGRFHVLAGTGLPMIQWVRRLAGVARHVVAVGSCAAWGGVSASGSGAAAGSSPTPGSGSGSSTGAPQESTKCRRSVSAKGSSVR